MSNAVPSDEVAAGQEGVGSEAPSGADDSRAAGDRLWRWYGGFLLVMVAVLAYSNSLTVPFVLDDLRQVRSSPLVRDLSLFFEPWRVTREAFPAVYVDSFFPRWFSTLTFALDYRLWGADVRGYHLTNFLIHLAAGFVLASIVRATLRLPRFDGSRLRGREEAVAFLVAAFFLLHPIQTQAVTYIVQRMASLTGLLALVGLRLFLAAATSERRGRARWLLAGSTLVVVLAMFSKQNAFVIPLLVVLFDLTVLAGAWRQRARRLVPLLLTLAIVPLQVEILWGSVDEPPPSSPSSGPVGKVGLAEYRLTQSRVLATYLRMLIAPYGQSHDHAYRLSRGLDPAVLATLALHAVLLAAAAALLLSRRVREPAWRLVGLGIAWFYVANLVESGLVALPDPIFEHRLYLPSVGIFLAVVAGAAALVRGPWVRAAAVFGLALAVSAAFATRSRNEVWKDEVSLWRDASAKAPRHVRAVYSLGYALARRGELEEAEELFRRTLELSPRHLHATLNAGILARRRGDRDRAHELFRRAVEISPRYWRALLNLGTFEWEAGRREEALRLFEAAAANQRWGDAARKRLEQARAALADPTASAELTVDENLPETAAEP